MGQAPAMASPDLLVVPLASVGLDAIAQVGGKNASLGEMIRQLGPRGVAVPGGFATTAAAYRLLLAHNGLEARLADLFNGLDASDLAALQASGAAARRLLLTATLPPALEEAIRQHYQQLCAESANVGGTSGGGTGSGTGSASSTVGTGGPGGTASTGGTGGTASTGGTDSAVPISLAMSTPVSVATPVPVPVAVRSSATAEDLPEASFAGQQESFLNVQGIDALLAACRRCYASLFTDRAISYRQINGFAHDAVALSIGVQTMVRSDLAASGVMFTIDTESGFREAVLLTAAYGLGENVVQGAVNPDEYLIFKPTLLQGHAPILSRRLGSKKLRMVYAETATCNVPVPLEERERFAIDDADVLTLARWACVIEAHYSALHGVPTAMDIEWAKDGLSGRLFILQARPETVQSRRSSTLLRRWQLDPHQAELIVEGRAIGASVSSGVARVLASADAINRFEPGDLLVTERTDPDWEPILRKASGVITNQGGRTCHAAIIAREMGITAIVGCGSATSRIADGDLITASCCEGDAGRVYRGALPFHVEEQELSELPPTRTRILVNVGNPEQAFQQAALPVDGVGLARLEFIIANHIQVHPMALLKPELVADAGEREAIAQRTKGYAHPADYYVDLLTQGMARIAAAFHPRPVILRFSDFKSNEYARLLGGSGFEPHEENPMLGWRGASRYTAAAFREAFGLECQALKVVREAMGLTNVIPMVPFCRTPEEGERVLAEMARHGLARGRHGLQVYVMCELPSNVIGAEAFAEHFDGFSIGSNDLTQLTLGLDRDSALVADLFDERHAIVKEMIRLAIRTAHRCGSRIGICGQAPSDYPDFARFLVEEGIDSISLNPDAVIATRLQVAAIEQELGKGP